MTLKPAWFQILLALAEGEAHGAGIRRRAEERSGGEIYPAMLYGSLDDLTTKGWIEELDEFAGRPYGASSRARFYRISDEGRRVLADETQRLEDLVRTASRALGLS